MGCAAVVAAWSIPGPEDAGTPPPWGCIAGQILSKEVRNAQPLLLLIAGLLPLC